MNLMNVDKQGFPEGNVHSIQRERERERQREREGGERETERQRERDRQTERERGGRERERETERETDSERKKERVNQSQPVVSKSTEMCSVHDGVQRLPLSQRGTRRHTRSRSSISRSEDVPFTGRREDDKYIHRTAFSVEVALSPTRPCYLTAAEQKEQEREGM